MDKASFQKGKAQTNKFPHKMTSTRKKKYKLIFQETILFL